MKRFDNYSMREQIVICKCAICVLIVLFLFTFYLIGSV